MKISDAQIDALREIINIGVGRAAGVLSEMVESHITLQVPYIKILTRQELKNEMTELGRSRISAVKLNFIGAFSGSAALVFPPESASKLVSVLSGESETSLDLDSLRSGTLSEVGNIVINGVMGSMSNILRQHMDYSLPNYVEDDINNLLSAEAHEADLMALLACTRFVVEQLHIEGDIILVFEVGSFDVLLSAIKSEG